MGEVLVHRFRRREGEVRAEVVYVDRESRAVRVRMDGKEYASLSSARPRSVGRHQPERLGLLGPQEASGPRGGVDEK